MGLFSYLVCIISLLLLSPFTFSTQESDDLEIYIIHVESPNGKELSSSEELERWYHSFLSHTNGASRMVYTYKNVLRGFAARLTADEAKAMENYSGFLHARPQRIFPLHTTHSPDFLGLHQNMGLWKDANYGKGVIIGVLDTGITPGHPSFSDQGMPPPPTKWKGKCEFNFTGACNNKLIGARYLLQGNESLHDENGHGTHTAGTAAGNFVKDADFFGQAYGTAVGVSPLSHLAVYKVCNAKGVCSESDVLSGMDAAIEDGVDILSISIGYSPNRFTSDAIALGGYRALQKGILVSCSAGNDGPSYLTLSNEAPWLLTVGASTIDRKISATAVLGNKEEIDGEAFVQPKNFPQRLFPLAYPIKDDPFCNSSKSLKNFNVSDKIVVCHMGDTTSVSDKAIAVRDAGGVAIILVDTRDQGLITSLLDPVPLPSTQISFSDGLKIKAYIDSTATPTATINFKGTVIGDEHAPIVASFSSRGPSNFSTGILKPDIIGPGVNILAAWPSSIEGIKHTKAAFNMISGTSMACPHLSGAVALLKSVHPDWSPAAIKSAIMTTADVVNLAHNPIEDQTLTEADIFATGAGHVNPSKAANPGLVYDLQPDDYIPYLCGLGYTTGEISIITQEKVDCSKESSILETQLNYPSFSILFGSEVQKYTRTLTNVGDAHSTYVVEISPPTGIQVAVEPDKIEFTEYKQKIPYEVTFTRLPSFDEFSFTQGFLAWRSAKYLVRSPIVAIKID